MSDDTRLMHQVVAVNHGPDGLTVEYGPGELHDPGSLPEGVGYRAVAAGDVDRLVAPAYAQPKRPAPEPAAVKTETAPTVAPAAPEPKTASYRK